MRSVEGPPAFKHAERQMQKFAHSSTDNHHHRLPLSEQILTEGLNDRVVAPSVNRREVKGFTQVAATDFRQPPSTLKRRPRLVLSRRQADKRSHLTGTTEIGKGNLSQQFMGRKAADTRDALEQFRILFERRVLVDVVADGRFNCRNLLVQIGNHRRKRIFDGTVQAGPLPILFLLLEVFKVFKSPNQRLQLFDLEGQRLPGFRTFFQTKTGDDQSVLLVGFVPTQTALGVVLDASGVNYADDETLTDEKLGQRHPVTTGGLEAGVKLQDTLLCQPVPQLLKSFWCIREDFVKPFALLVSEQYYVEASLANVNPKYHLASRPLNSNAPWASLVNAGSRLSGPKIPSDLKKRGKGDLISFSGCKPVL